MEGKKKYFALILFLFLGLMIFTFANPDEEPIKETTKKKDGNGIEEVTKKETDVSDENTLDVVAGDDKIPVGVIIRRNNTINNTNNSSNDSNTTTVDNSYEKALAAVKLAEETLSSSNVSSAQTLVNLVKNTNQKDELNKRLETVNNTINAIELVEKLENMVKEASNKEDIYGARSYRTDEKIATIVSELTNTTVKEDLTNRLDVLAKLLDDDKNPVISGIDNNTFTKNKEVTIAIADDNNFTVKATLNGKEVEFTNTFTEEGTYVIIAIDEAFNEETLTFTIDRTKPKITGVEDSVYYNSDVTPVIEEDNIQNITVKFNDKKLTSYKAGDTLTKEGVYQIRVSDKAGNKIGYITFTIDKTVPEAEVTKSNNDKSTNEDVVVTIKANEPISMSEDWNKISDTTYQKIYSENGKYKALITDKAGNQTNVSFEVKRIDKVAPEAEVIKSNNDQPINKDVVVTIKANEAIYKPEGWTEVKTNKEHEFTKTYSDNGKYTVVITDKAGNQTKISFEVKGIDKVAPVITVKDDSVGKDGVYSKINLKLYDNVNLSKVIVNNKEYLRAGTWNDLNFQNVDNYVEGENTVVLEDKAGNQTTFTFVLDKTAPTIKKVQIWNKDNIESSYIRNGQTIRVLATFSEDLEQLPTLTIGNYSSLFKKISGSNSEVIYSADITISSDESELNEGLISFAIGDYADKAGNIGKDVTEKKLTKNLTYDRTAPTITPTNNSIGKDEIYSKIDLKLFDKNGNLSKVIVNNKEYSRVGTWNDLNFQNVDNYVEGENIVVLEDKAGNQTTFTFILDKTAPVFKDAKATMEIPAKIDVDEANLDKITVINKNNQTTFDCENGYELSEEGFYKIIAYDKAGNSTVWNLTLDNEAPVLTIENAKDNNLYNTDVVINITDIELQQTYLDGIRQGRINTLTVKDEGNHTVKAVDKYGHESEITFTIDKTAPTVEVSYNTKNPAQSVTVTLSSNEEFEVINAGTWDKKGYNKTFKKVYYSNVNQTVTIRDKAGNEATVEVIINNVDRVAPTATVTVSDHNGDGKWVTFKFNETIDESTLPGQMSKVSGEENTYKKVYYKSGSLTVKDLAGNESTIPFELN